MPNPYFVTRVYMEEANCEDMEPSTPLHELFEKYPELQTIAHELQYRMGFDVVSDLKLFKNEDMNKAEIASLHLTQTQKNKILEIVDNVKCAVRRAALKRLEQRLLDMKK